MGYLDGIASGAFTGPQACGGDQLINVASEQLEPYWRIDSRWRIIRTPFPFGARQRVDKGSPVAFRRSP